eukprot:4083155-Karenia_brevis.AAC.1
MERGSDRTDVVALRSAGEVWVGTARVAKWNGTDMKLRGEALEAKERIEALMAATIRKPTDSLSE